MIAILIAIGCGLFVGLVVGTAFGFWLQRWHWETEREMLHANLDVALDAVDEFVPGDYIDELEELAQDQKLTGGVGGQGG